MKRVLYLAVLLLLYGHLSIAGVAGIAASPDSLPVPKGLKDMKYYVQRDPNANTVIYELNRTANGKLNEKNPIHIFWIRYAEGGERKELNYVQRTFAYGLNTRKLAKDEYELKFVCYSKLALNLRKGEDGKYQVYTTINKREAILDRVFVRVEGGTFWVPNVLYVELKGRDAVTGKAVTGRFKP